MCNFSSDEDGKSELLFFEAAVMVSTQKSKEPRWDGVDERGRSIDCVRISAIRSLTGIIGTATDLWKK